MRVTFLLTAAAAAASSVAAVPWGLGGFGSNDILRLLGVDMTRDGHYGAAVPPWQPNATPGWYFGNRPERHGNLRCLSGILCNILKLFPRAIQCPPRPPPNPPPSPGDGYTQTFSNLTGATQAPGYLTFGLVETVADCKAMCNNVQGCQFANTYHDVNGKDGSPLLTCSLYDACQTAATATNTGGQTQPDGSVNYITNSDGWCKQS
ncbi:hypothetical protein AX16_010707 [Volvariella volvacea WC 439]|nr:hypothetical protein AX16_010707 [Volvariella volvacea WC 439]